MPTFERLIAATSLCTLVAGCGGSDAAAPDGGVSDWPQVRGAYGLLDTIAGTALLEEDRNEWDPSFEGGAATEAELSNPHFAMADDAGNVYIADKEAHAIRRVTPAGVISTVAGTNEPGDGSDEPGPATSRPLSNPNGLYVLPDGTLYVLDLDNGKIRRVTPAGEMTTVFEDPRGFAAGRGLWVAPDEREIFVAAGTVVRRWTAADGLHDVASGFVGLGNLAMDRAGRLLVADRAGHTVYRLAIEPGEDRATPVAIAGDGSSGPGEDGRPALETALDEVRAVWPAHEGDGFFVGTHEGSQVWFVDAAGIAHLFLDGPGAAFAGDGLPYDAPGTKVSEVRSVSLDRDGNLLVVERDEGAVRVVRRE